MTVDDATKEGNKVLKNLRAAVAGRHVTLSPGCLRTIKGLVLLHSKKGAAVLGFESGTGLAFKVIAQSEDGNYELSPPVFLKLTKLTVGLQLGYNSVYTLIAIYNDETLDALVSSKNGLIVGKDFDVAGLGNVHDTSSTNTFHRTSLHTVEGPPDPSKEKAKIITVSDSFMVFDLSLYGGSLGVDTSLMEQAYGSKVSANDVWEGKVPSPPALLEELKDLASNLGILAAQ